MRVAAAILLSIPLIACSTQTVPPPPPTQTAVAQSQAANLRTHLDLLLGEHVMIVAKESAAAVNHADEYPAYTSLLATNSNDLTTVFGRAFGTTAAQQFAQLWNRQNGMLVDYAIGVVAHNDDKSSAAMTGLTGTFVAQFAQLISAQSGVPADTVSQIMAKQEADDKAFIDDLFAGRFSTYFADLHRAYAQTSQLGDALAVQIAQLFPDKFSGDPAVRRVDLRVSSNLLLQEHSYLSTMATAAAVAKRDSEKTAAVSALATSAKTLAKVWLDWDGALVAYAANSHLQSSTFIDTLTTATGATTPNVRFFVEATIKAVDDQKAKSSRTIADDDRAAATATQPIADSIA